MKHPFYGGLLAAFVLLGAQAHALAAEPAPAEGMATLLGVDADANGIRDDVDALILGWAKGSGEHRALAQMGKALQRALVVDVADETQRVTVVHALGAAVACLRATYPHGESTQRLNALQDATVNTKARKAAYAKFNGAANGTVLRLPKNLGCAV